MRQPCGLFLCSAVIILLATNYIAWAADWTTPYERSGGKVTPRYAETIEYCRKLAAASPWLQYETFGTSPRGRDLPLVIANRHGRFTPEAVRETDGVVVLVQAGIHAGEICGKDAGLMLLRDLTVTGERSELLDNVTLLFVPIFNVDGHERFGPYNRINQNGPEQMGWRVTAQNLNLNRDYLKADTPEMRAWLKLFNAWLPDFFVDIHSTDGADYQYAVSYGLEIHGNIDDGLAAWTRDHYLPALEAGLATTGFPLTPYVIFRRWHDPTSGLVSWAASPRLSQGYTALQNRPGLLVETHMLKEYPTRVAAAYAVLVKTLGFLNDDHRRLRDLVQAADAAAAAGRLREQPFPLRFEMASDSVMVDFLGVEYEELQSDLTGGTWFRYGSEPVTYRIPHFNIQQSSVTVDLPEAYIIPAEWPEVARRLSAHGVVLNRLERAASVTVRSYRFSEAAWQERPYEGRHPVSFEVESITEERLFPPGSFVVDMRQRAARVAANVLEPQAPDSYVYWGFFDAIFERVEYVESYVIEDLAREMLAEDPALAQELFERKAADPEFAKDPWAIRYWFYARSPYYDQRVNLYPVGLIDDRTVVETLPVGDG